jgi:hypothetical protein
MDLDGGPFTKTLKESRTEVRSFEKDMKFLSQGMGLAFGVQVLEKFAAAYKDLKSYEQENGIQLVDPDTESHLDSVISGLQHMKMEIIAVGVTWVDNVAKAVQATAAGLASGFDEQTMAKAIAPELTDSDVKDVKTAYDKEKKSEKALTQEGQTKDDRLADLKNETEEMQRQWEHSKKGLELAVKRGIEDKLQAQWLKENLELHDKLNIKLLEQGRLAKEVEKLHEEDEKANKAADAQVKSERLEEDANSGPETPKKKLSRLFEDVVRIKARNDEEERTKGIVSNEHRDQLSEAKIKVKEEAASQQKEEKKLAIEGAVKTAERGYELQDATSHIGFQHQSGGAYAGLVGNQQNKDLSIAERNAKAAEKLVQLAEHWARRDAVDKIKHGDGL